LFEYFMQYRERIVSASHAATKAMKLLALVVVQENATVFRSAVRRFEVSG
jgi:hypothetical protein